MLWLYNTTLGQVEFDDEALSASGSNGSYDEGNSDCIIIASLNYDTKEVQLVSLYRDTYLSSGNGRYTKANGAYSAGGVKERYQWLIQTLTLISQNIYV